MAYVTKKDQMHYIELGSFVVDFTEGDVMLLDNVTDISPLYPLKPMTTLIAMCCRGSQTLTANGNNIVLSEGNILLCPPNVRVSGGECSKDFECRVVCVSDNLIRGLLRDKIDIWHHTVYVNQVNLLHMPAICQEDFGFYFTLIRSKLKKSNPAAPYEIMLALLRAFLLELCFMMESTSQPHHEQKLSQGKILFNRFLSLISNSHVKRQPISFYAGTLAITPKYLTMLCLKYSNKTASEWVAQYTVEEIRFFLKSTDLSIKEISARMGFSNMSHFGSYVRKHLGVSPSEYRYSKKG
jgi:AraC-like DNA-binding protein